MHGPAGKSSTELREVGEHEAEEIDVSLPFKKRVLAEVKGYNDEYGITSLADVVTEINSRGKDLEFQGELSIYATKNEKKVKRAIDQLVKEGKIREVKVKGSRVGYVAVPRSTSTVEFRTSRKTRKKYPRHRRGDGIDASFDLHGRKQEAGLWDTGSEDIL
jgi:hypothetical protein